MKKDEVEIPVVSQRDGNLKSGNVCIVDYLNFIFGQWLDRAPADMQAEHRPNADCVPWRVTDLESGDIQTVENMESRFFRSVLGRIGATYLPGQLYGGHRRCRFRFKDTDYGVTLFFGNDSQTGLWFRGRCVKVEG